jgi:RNA polymerase sigma-70 factor (ECF subfamily)
VSERPDILAFNTLFNEYFKSFVRFAVSYIGDRQASEDIVSDSFTYYWDNRGRLPSDLNAKAYILKTVKNKCLNSLRHKDVINSASEKIKDHQERVQALRISTLEACDPEELFCEDTMRIIRETLSKMPDKTRRIFEMSRMEDKTYGEIAESLSLSVKTVEFHISKALKLLMASLPFGVFVFFL